MTGIIVGWGFQFYTTKGKPNKKKSVSLVSNEFGFEAMGNNAPIKMRELVRENGEFSSNSAGAKTYAQWKEEGMRLTKIVYMLDANDLNRMYKIQFSGLSFGEINRILKDDAPNYVVTLRASTTLKSTENGDFYMPSIVKEGDTPEAAFEKVKENVIFVYNILNDQNDTDAEYITEPVSTDGVTADEVGAMFDDMP